jgi:hypothetical protein
MLHSVGYPLYHRLQREIGDRPVYVVILPASSARLSAARELGEIEEAFGRTGIYLLSLGDGEAVRVVDTRGVVGQVTRAQVTDALHAGVDPEASYRAGLMQSVRALVAAADGRAVRSHSTGSTRRWLAPVALLAAIFGAVVVVRLRVRSRNLSPR